jgi:hypothetical protein
MAPDVFTELKKGSAETLILALLEDGPRHGYDLAKRIEERSAGRERLVAHRRSWREFVAAIDGVVLKPA